MKLGFYAIRAAGMAFFVALAGSVVACPFCNVESKTLSEETNGADAVVLAKLVKEAPEAAADSNDPNAGMATFQVVEAMKGGRLSSRGRKSTSYSSAIPIVIRRT